MRSYGLFAGAVFFLFISTVCASDGESNVATHGTFSESFDSSCVEGEVRTAVIQSVSPAAVFDGDLGEGEAEVTHEFIQYSDLFVQGKDGRASTNLLLRETLEYKFICAKQLECVGDTERAALVYFGIIEQREVDPWLKFNAMWALVMLERMNISEIRKVRQDLPVYSPLNEPAKEQ